MAVKIKTILHEFSMGDVEDPALYAAFPLGEWERSEAGQWAMRNCVGEPVWNMSLDPHNYGYRVIISGDLLPHDHTYFRLKFYDYTKR
jgi:hypothetical protein